MNITPALAWKAVSAATFGTFAVAAFKSTREESIEEAQGGGMNNALSVGTNIGEALCAAEIGAAAIGAKLLVEHAEVFGGTTAKVLGSRGAKVATQALAPVLLGIGAGRLAGAVYGGVEGAFLARKS